MMHWLFVSNLSKIYFIPITIDEIDNFLSNNQYRCCRPIWIIESILDFVQKPFISLRRRTTCKPQISSESKIDMQSRFHFLN